MSTQTADTSVRTSVIVAATIERAFSVFTDEMATWWPPFWSASTKRRAVCSERFVLRTGPAATASHYWTEHGR